MRYLLIFSRYLLGFIFLLSGLIKLIDPLGFSYKLEEYFFSLKLTFLINYSLILSILFCFYEALFGLFLLVGVLRKMVLYSLFLFILFFSFVTFYIAYFSNMKDCGCFGDFIKLSPWESFSKNLILLVLILLLLYKKNSIKQHFSNRKTLLLLLVGLSLFVWVPYHGLYHLPLIDFRPYKVGVNIHQGMKNAEELGLEPPLYEIFQDFYIIQEGKDITSDLLNKDYVLFIIVYNIEKISLEKKDQLEKWLKENNKFKSHFLGISSSSLNSYPYSISWSYADLTMLKTMVRSNPAFVLLKKGTIIKKWHWNDRPTPKELDSLCNT